MFEHIATYRVGVHCLGCVPRQVRVLSDGSRFQGCMDIGEGFDCPQGRAFGVVFNGSGVGDLLGQAAAWLRSRGLQPSIPASAWGG